jgi:hypothetical protein
MEWGRQAEKAEQNTDRRGETEGLCSGRRPSCLWGKRKRRGEKGGRGQKGKPPPCAILPSDHDQIAAEVAARAPDSPTLHIHSSSPNLLPEIKKNTGTHHQPSWLPPSSAPARLLPTRRRRGPTSTRIGKTHRLYLVSGRCCLSITTGLSAVMWSTY